MNSPRHTLPFRCFAQASNLCVSIRFRNACLFATALAWITLFPASLMAQDSGGSQSFTISSPSFSNGAEVPTQFTCTGGDISPQLVWNAPPSGTKSLALLVDDPDAPIGNWTHWVVWNVPDTSRGLAEGVVKKPQLPDGSQQGTNDFHKVGYNGPCPPAGKPHRYYFKLFALDTKLDLKPASGKRELEAAIKGHVLAQAEWIGKFHR